MSNSACPSLEVAGYIMTWRERGSPPRIYSVGIFRKPQMTKAQPLWSARSYLWVLNVCLKEGGGGVL